MSLDNTGEELVETPKAPPEAAVAPTGASRVGFGYRLGGRAARALASKAFPLVCIGVGVLVIVIRAAAPALEPIVFFSIFAAAAATLLAVGHFFIRPLSELLHESENARRIKPHSLPHQRGIDLLVAIGKSIQGQRDAAAELGLQRDRYRDLIAGVDAILWEADPESWQMRFVSPRAEAILGYPVTQWLDEPQFWAEHLHPDDRFHAVRRCLQPLDSGKYFQSEYRMLAADGRVVWLRDVMHLVETAAPDGGRARVIRGLAYDITHQKESAATLETERAALKRLLENLPGMAYRCLNDEHWTCEMLSEGTVALTGYQPEDLIGNRRLTYAELIHPDDREMVRQRVNTALAEGKRFQATYRITDASGIEKWVWEQGCSAADSPGREDVLEGFIIDISERVRAEIESNRLASIPMANPNPILIFDRTGCVTYSNPATIGVLETLGLSEVNEIFPADHAAILRDLQEGRHAMFTTESDLGRRVIRWQYHAIPEFGVVHLYGTDITSMRRAEESLRQSEERFRMVVEHYPGMLLVFDRDRRICYINSRALAASGHAEDQVLGRRNEEALPESVARVFEPHMTRTYETKQPQSFSATLAFAQGHHEVAATYVPILGPDGEIAEVLGVTTDISELKAAERALKEERDRAQQYLDLSGAMFVALDSKYRITMVNRALCAALEFEDHELLGRPWIETCVPPRLRTGRKPTIDRIYDGDPSLRQVESIVMTKSGKERSVIWHNNLLRNEDGAVTGIIASGLDITDRIAVERERVRAHSVLRATLEAAEDGILVVDLAGKILAYNRRFVEMWDVPEELLIAGDDTKVLAHVTAQTANPEQFLARVKELYADLGVTASDMIEVGDGRVLERHSSPQILDGHTVGRVWSFRDRTQAIRAERELRESREYLDTVMRSSSDIISVIDENSIFTHVSGAVEPILGWAPDELIGTQALDLLSPDSRSEALRLLAALLANSGGEQDFHLTFIHRDGSERVLEGVGRDLRHQPAIRGILVNSHDVTERDYNERVAGVLARILQAVNDAPSLSDLLKFSREQIGSLMDVTNFYVALYDESSGLYTFPYIVDEVDHVEDIPPQAMKNSLTDFIRRHGEPMLVDEATQHRLAEEHEIEQVGHWSPIWLGVPLRTNGPVFGVVAVQSYHDPNLYGPRELHLLTQIAERIALAIERRQAFDVRLRLAAAVEQVVETVVITDTEGVIQYVNPAFTRITGYSAEEAVGKNPRILASGHHPQDFYSQLWSTLKSGETWKGRFVNKKKDGSLYTEDATVTPVRDHTGAIVNFVAIKRDITEQLQLEAHLRQAQKLESVGSLAAGIAHEINTPIQFVGDNVRFMKESFQDILSLTDRMLELVKVISEPGPDAPPLPTLPNDPSGTDLDYLKEEIPKAIDQTLEGVERIATIVRAMKDFSHPDQGARLPSDINRALRSTLTVARNEFKYVADLVTDFDESLPSVWCFLSDLNQAFLNIIVNAAHAIGDSQMTEPATRGTITVRTKRLEDAVLISISDTGTGIPEDIRERVFDHFFTTKEVGRGTGQGLTIARAVVVDKHGGDLTFETEEGKGTTFHIRLPVGAPSEAELTRMLEEK